MSLGDKLRFVEDEEGNKHLQYSNDFMDQSIHRWRTHWFNVPTVSIDKINPKRDELPVRQVDK